MVIVVHAQTVAFPRMNEDRGAGHSLYIAGQAAMVFVQMGEYDPLDILDPIAELMQATFERLKCLRDVRPRID